MLKYGKVAKHNFLGPSWATKFQEAGISMNDASWWIIEDSDTKELYVIGEEELWIPEKKIPTYTLPDLLYKLSEYIYGKDIKGPLEFSKDAPFYTWYYGGDDKNYCGTSENPLEAAAELLIKTAKGGLGYIRNIKTKFGESYLSQT